MGISSLKGAVDLLSDTILGGSKRGNAPYAHTRIAAFFYSDEGFDGGVSSYDNPDVPIRIVGFTYDKSFGGGGTWTLNVKAKGGKDLLRLWKEPEDVWVKIVAWKNDDPEKEILTGLINTITETTDRGSKGERTVVYQITGNDFQKVFSRTLTFINIHEHGGQLPVTILYDAVKEKLGGPPDFIVRTIIETWLGNKGVADKQWRLPKSLGGNYFFDELDLDFGDKLKGYIHEPALFDPTQWMGRSLWDMCTEYSNGIFNEIFTRTDPEQNISAGRVFPQLILRERPFPTKEGGNKVWEKLPTFPIAARNVARRQISKGSPESRFNFWLFDAKGWIGDGYGTLQMIHIQVGKSPGIPGSVPIYDLEDIRKHGLRKWQQSSNYFPWRDKPEFLAVSAEWLQMVHDWYAISPYALTGTITTSELFPEIELGGRLIESRPDGDVITYYIEGFRQGWSYPGPGSTTLNLTRGEYADENLLDLVYQNYDNSLESAINAAMELVKGSLWGIEAGNYPTGSSVQWDRLIGQLDTPERQFLRDRGKLESDVKIKQGELTYREDERAKPKAADLPNRQLPKYKEESISGTDPETAKPGSLTQQELENGTLLPVNESKENEVEPALLTPDEKAVRNLRTTRTRKSRVR